MKRRFVGISVLVLALAMVLLAMSCAPGPQNGNTSQNQTQVQTAPTRSPNPPENDDPDAPECNGTDLTKMRDDVQRRLDRPPFDKLLKFQVVIVGSHLEVYVENMATPDARRVPRNMTKSLDNALKKVMKGGCVTRVIFVAPGTIPVSGVERVEGFEWGCNDPNVLCTNGECLRPEECPNPGYPTATPPPTSNSNRNTGNSANNGTNP